MPITLPAVSRRCFIATSTALGVGLALPRFANADIAKVDPHRFVLFSDTHIAGKKETKKGETNMHANLTQAVKEALADEIRPAALVVNGDCAYNTGETTDYETFIATMQPIRDAGVPVHLVLGNHDQRERIWKAIPPAFGENKVVEERHLAVIRGERANFVLLDSLDLTNKTPGKLGEAQLAWLGKTLDAIADKPAIVMVHHNPQGTTGVPGIAETKELLEMLNTKKQVKALIFGHTHQWFNKQEASGIHFINLPPTAYTFAKDKPSGWIDVRLATDGATLQLKSIDPAHPEHNKKVELKWRA